MSDQKESVMSDEELFKRACEEHPGFHTPFKKRISVTSDHSLNDFQRSPERAIRTLVDEVGKKINEIIISAKSEKIEIVKFQMAVRNVNDGIKLNPDFYVHIEVSGTKGDVPTGNIHPSPNLTT